MMNTDMTTSGAPPDAPEPGLLSRPRTNRLIGGVASGIARRLNVSPWVVRVIFGVLTIPGGFGIALYAAGWLLIPEEGSDAPIASRLVGRARGAQAWIGVALIGIAVIVFAETLDFIRGDLILAAFLIVVGVLLYRGELGRPGPDRPYRPDEATTPAPRPSPESPRSDDPPSPPPPAQPMVPPPPAVPPPPPNPPSMLGRVTFGLTIVAVGVMALVESLRSDFDPSLRHYLGLALGMIAAGLLVGAFAGRARGLIVLGALLIPPLLISPLADLDVPVTFGERVYSPDSVTDVRPSYRLGFGHLVVDLTGIDYSGEATRLEADLGVGQIEIFVPDDVAVTAVGTAKAGSVRLFGNERNGVGITNQMTVDGPDGSITIDAHVNAGEIRVYAGSTPAPRLGRGFREFSDLDLAVDGATDLRGDYRLAAGNLTLDLSNLQLETFRRVQVEVGTGEMHVILPDSFTTRVDAHVGIGDIDLLGRTRSGVDQRDTETWGDGKVLLQLDLEVGAGEITVEGEQR